MLKENEIYVIQFNYSTEDTDGIDLYLFRNFDTAFAKFKSIIKDEKKYSFKDFYSVILREKPPCVVELG